MLFNSVDYIIFFLITVTLYFITKPAFRWILLLVASYFFYMYWRYEYILLIVLSTGIDYYCGTQMSKKDSKQERRPYLLFSLISNLGLLFTFKYLDFFATSTNAVFGTTIPMAELILPMGISFYTFQTLSYSIDVYNGKIQFEKHFGKFALYVSFFPQLVAGPIERASHLLPQLTKNDNKLNYNNVVSGFTQVMIGFFKKVVIADTLALYVEGVYGTYDLHTGFTLWFTIYLFAIQIYCDFSGYSDIAIGCARIMGYDLMENFRQPYFAKSVTEFWRRWHISLSTWLRDYLYIPLGGNKLGKFNTYKNLMVTMILGGLWHGASWNFVIWGTLNGLYLSLEKRFRIPEFIEGKSKLVKFLGMVVVFHLICLTWVFFRAETFEKAIGIIDRMFAIEYFINLNIKDTGVFASILLNTTIFILLEVFLFRKLDLRNVLKKTALWKVNILNICLFLLILLYGISEGSQFIYFQF